MGFEADNRMMRFLSATMVLVSAAACMGDRDPQTGDPASVLRIEKCGIQYGDPYTLGALSIEDKALVAHVQTGGGCERHGFAVCWDGSILDSSPPQVVLGLSHDAHGDHCDALLTWDLHIDLTAVRVTYPTPLILHIAGATGQLEGTDNAVTLRD